MAKREGVRGRKKGGLRDGQSGTGRLVEEEQRCDIRDLGPQPVIDAYQPQLTTAGYRHGTHTPPQTLLNTNMNRHTRNWTYLHTHTAKHNSKMQPML